jgi:hypothetical protein
VIILVHYENWKYYRTWLFIWIASKYEYIYILGGGGGGGINKLIIIWALADLRSMHKSILVYLSKKMEKEKYFGKIDVITWLSCISNNNI